MKKFALSIILSLLCLFAFGGQTEYVVKCQETGAKKVVLLERIHGTMYKVRVSWSPDNGLLKETHNGRLLILTSRDLFHWSIQKELRFGPSYPGNYISQCSYVDYGLFVEDDYSMPKTSCVYYKAKIVFD